MKHKQKRCEKKRIKEKGFCEKLRNSWFKASTAKLNLARAMLIFLTFIVLVNVVRSADPGHAASSISAGLFEGEGNFTFPDSLFIEEYFNATDVLFVDPLTNRVGIGTASPGSVLEVSGTGHTRIDVRSTGADNLAGIRLIGRSSSSDYSWYIDSRGGSEAPVERLSIFNNLLAEVFTISSAGSVGIGTTTPAYKLQVEGTTNTTGLRTEGLAHFRANVTLDDNLTVGGDKFFVDTSSGRVGIGTTNPWGGSGSFSGAKLQVRPGAEENLLITYNSDIGGIALHAVNDAVSANIPLELRGNVTAFTTGNVSIGTTTPTASLHIVGSTIVGQGMPSLIVESIEPRIHIKGTEAEGTTIFIQEQNSNLRIGESGVLEWLRIQNVTGNVGIGTASPATKLDVVGGNVNITGTGIGNVLIGGWDGTDAYGAIGLAGSLSAAGYNLLSSPSDPNLYINRPTDYGIFFRQNNVDQMIIANGGNVGIGTIGSTSPSALLHLNSTYAGGSGDYTDITNAPLKIQSAGVSDYWRIPHISGSATVSGVYNYETGKSAYWGETGDTGIYHFRGRNLTVDNGQAGIGTTDPGLRLESYGSLGTPATSGTAQTGAIRIGASGTNVVLDMGVHNSPNVGWLQATYRANLATEYDLALNPNGGNVGIGTTAPSKTLEVVGTAAVNALNATSLTVSGTGMFGTANVDETLLGMSVNTAGHEGVSLYHDGAEAWITSVDAGTAWHDLTLQANNVRFDMGGAADKVIITSTGQVGIGTTSPGVALNVSGNFQMGNWYFDADDDTWLRLLNADDGATYKDLAVGQMYVLSTAYLAQAGGSKVLVGAAGTTHTFNVVGTTNITRAAGAAGGIEVDGSGNVIIRLG